jgi:hypothetical protein
MGELQIGRRRWMAKSTTKTMECWIAVVPDRWFNKPSHEVRVYYQGDLFYSRQHLTAKLAEKDADEKLEDLITSGGWTCEVL